MRGADGRSPRFRISARRRMLRSLLDCLTAPMRPIARSLRRLWMHWLGLLMALILASAHAETIADPRKLVADSWTTLGHFLDDPEQGHFREMLPQAKAILIVPKLYRAGFVVGGAGGTALLLARQPGNAGWSQPAFMNLSGPSLGLQAGADVSEVLYLVMTDAGLKGLMSARVKLGGSLGVAAGGSGAASEGTLTADLLSFARGQGLYAGVVGKGMVLESDVAAVRTYYGQEATPEDILMRKKVYNRDASKLVSLLAKAARPVTTK